MPLYFQARSQSSYDPVSGITILVSRIMPAELPDGTQGTEYQYAFYQGDERIAGLGFSGPDKVMDSDGWREHVSFFDLGRASLVEALLAFKKKIANPDDDFEFLQQFAQGLVLAYAGQTHNREDLRYIAVTTAEALASRGVLISDESPVSSEGTIVLAEVSVPAHIA